jgi:hypothetical protein
MWVLQTIQMFVNNQRMSSLEDVLALVVDLPNTRRFSNLSQIGWCQ